METISQSNDNNFPFVSIIVACYNAEITIMPCLEAIFQQTYPFYEVIVVDDFSEDDTVKKANLYPVEIIKNCTNKGVSFSRNIGAKYAKGDLLVFVDSDVVIPPDGVLTISQFLLTNPEILMVQTNYSPDADPVNFISDYKNLDLSYRDFISPSKYSKSVAAYFFVIKTSVFKESGGFDEDFDCVEDIEFAYRVCKGEPKVYQCQDIKVKHLKKYSFISMFKTNFMRVIWMKKIFVDSKGKYKVGEALPYRYLFNVFLSFFFIISIPILIYDVCFFYINLSVFIICFIINNYAFFRFIQQKRNIVFSILCFPVMVFEYIGVTLILILSFLKII